MSKFSNCSVFKVKNKLIIDIGSSALTAFDWIENQKNDLIVCGDYGGNIYLIKVDESKFEIIKVYFQAHSEDITDLRFFPINTNQEILFASCSNDGYLKIFDSNDNQTPLYDIQISKVKNEFI